MRLSSSFRRESTELAGQPASLWVRFEINDTYVSAYPVRQLKELPYALWWVISKTIWSWLRGR